VTKGAGRGLSGDVHRVRGFATGDRVGEANHLSADDSEDLVEGREELRIGRIVGPQREHPAGTQVKSETAQPCRSVERGVTGMQDMS